MNYVSNNWISRYTFLWCQFKKYILILVHFSCIYLKYCTNKCVIMAEKVLFLRKNCINQSHTKNMMSDKLYFKNARNIKENSPLVCCCHTSLACWKHAHIKYIDFIIFLILMYIIERYIIKFVNFFTKNNSIDLY